MNTDLLLTLANRLERDPDVEGHFNLAIWQDQTECGFVACAVGWACKWPEFELEWDSVKQEPAYGDFSGFMAVMDYFGLRYEDVCNLFVPREGYSTPQDVATAIRELVGAVPIPEIVLKQVETVEVR